MSSAKQMSFDHATRSAAASTHSSQAWFSAASLQGRLRSPAASAWRMRSSTRAWRRWRISSTATGDVSRPLLSHDHPRPLRQAEVEQPRDLRDEGAVTHAFVHLDRLVPGSPGRCPDRLADLGGDRKAEAEADTLKGPSVRSLADKRLSGIEASRLWRSASSTAWSAVSPNCFGSIGWTRPPRMPRFSCSVTNWPSCAARSPDLASLGPTGRSSRR